MPHESTGAAAPGKGSGSEKINNRATASITTTIPLVAELTYVSRGWRVMWAPRGLKPPTVNGGQDLDTTDLTTVTNWFAGRPKRNVCIATGAGSGIFVLDLDDAVTCLGAPCRRRWARECYAKHRAGRPAVMKVRYYVRRAARGEASS